MKNIIRILALILCFTSYMYGQEKVTLTKKMQATIKKTGKLTKRQAKKMLSKIKRRTAYFKAVGKNTKALKVAVKAIKAGKPITKMFMRKLPVVAAFATAKTVVKFNNKMVKKNIGKILSSRSSGGSDP